MILSESYKNRLSELAGINENRFVSPERPWEELKTILPIQRFIQHFNKTREKLMSGVEIEVKPVFADVEVKFVDKDFTGRDVYISDSKAEDGDVIIRYNDITAVFKPNMGFNNSGKFEYKYSHHTMTDYNQPRSQQGREVNRLFIDMCKNLSFTLSRLQVPTRFYIKEAKPT